MSKVRQAVWWALSSSTVVALVTVGAAGKKF